MDIITHDLIVGSALHGCLLIIRNVSVMVCHAELLVLRILRLIVSQLLIWVRVRAVTVIVGFLLSRPCPIVVSFITAEVVIDIDFLSVLSDLEILIPVPGSAVIDVAGSRCPLLRDAEF